jgi:hypothetical protein
MEKEKLDKYIKDTNDSIKKLYDNCVDIINEDIDKTNNHNETDI